VTAARRVLGYQQIGDAYRMVSTSLAVSALDGATARIIMPAHRMPHNSIALVHLYVR